MKISKIATLIWMAIVFGGLTLILTLAGQVKAAKRVYSGPYLATVYSAYDGDTFTAEVEIWPGIKAERSIRPNGYDSPEMRGKCLEEKFKAKEARNYLRRMILGKVLVLKDVKEGKWAGRVVATVFFQDGTPLAALMIKEGHGRLYDGKSAREGWC